MPRRLSKSTALIIAIFLAIIVFLGWYWYRGSSFVKIKHVTVTGLSGPDVSRIRNALTQEALTMTTLNLDISKLEKSVAAYPVVSSITTTTHGSHAITINVVERIPVATVNTKIVDGAGYVLPQRSAPSTKLPLLKPSGHTGDYVVSAGRVIGSGNRAALQILAAAPYIFLPHVKSAGYTGAAHGVVLQLRNGPQVYFGSATQLQRKWNAVVAILNDSSSAGACYINVVDPQHPAAGAPSSSSCASGHSGSGTTTTAGSQGSSASTAGSTSTTAQTNTTTPPTTGTQTTSGTTSTSG